MSDKKTDQTANNQIEETTRTDVEIMQILGPKLSSLIQDLPGEVDRTLDNAFRKLWTKREEAIIHQIARILTPKYQHELGLSTEEYDPDLVTLQLEQQLRQAIDQRPRKKGRPARAQNPLAQYLPSETDTKECEKD